MFKRPTVIVVGAGASFDLGFPLGNGLRYSLSKTFKQILSDEWQLRGPAPLLEGIRSDAALTNTDLNEYLQTAKILASHILYARSIDEFIDHYQDNRVLVLIAKMGICSVILESENKCSLFNKQDNQHFTVKHEFLDANDVWLKQLWYMMREEVPRSSPARLFENISFINFNYDRTLEAFLTMALEDMYDLSKVEAASLVDNAPIYHPYGVVDNLSSTPFGGGRHANLVRLKDNIRTYTESEASPQKAAFEGRLRDASFVVFLGFAYRPLNLELLKSIGLGRLKVFGTAVGIPEENFAGIEGRLSHVLERTNGGLSVRLRDVKCAELLRLNEVSLIS